MPALSECLACHASNISDKRFTKTSTDDDQKKGTYDNAYSSRQRTFVGQSLRLYKTARAKKETHEVVDERIKKTWPKIQWWTIINA